MNVTPWPFSFHPPEESSVLDLIPGQKSEDAVVAFRLNKYTLVVGKSVDLLGADNYNLSELEDGTELKWMLLPLEQHIDDQLNDLQLASNKLVILTNY